MSIINDFTGSLKYFATYNIYRRNKDFFYKEDLSGQKKCYISENSNFKYDKETHMTYVNNHIKEKGYIPHKSLKRIRDIEISQHKAGFYTQETTDKITKLFQDNLSLMNKESKIELDTIGGSLAIGGLAFNFIPTFGSNFKIETMSHYIS